MILLTTLLATLQLQSAQLDTTLRVPAGTRLEAMVGAGSLRVQGWDRPDVRVVSKHEGRTQVSVTLDGGVLRVRSWVATGVDLADVTISAPREMNMNLGHGDVDITVVDSEGEVNALNYRGTIDVTGGRRVVTLKSNLGPINLRGARARVDVVSAFQQIKLSDIIGDVHAEATIMHITMENIASRNLKAESVGGVIKFTGPLFPDGHYSFETHSGSVWVTVQGEVNATVAVGTSTGAFSSNLPYRKTDVQRANIFKAIFGDGRAQVVMESFMGGLVLRQIDKSDVPLRSLNLNENDLRRLSSCFVGPFRVPWDCRASL